MDESYNPFVRSSFPAVDLRRSSDASRRTNAASRFPTDATRCSAAPSRKTSDAGRPRHGASGVSSRTPSAIVVALTVETRARVFCSLNLVIRPMRRVIRSRRHVFRSRRHVFPSRRRVCPSRRPLVVPVHVIRRSRPHAHTVCTLVRSYARTFDGDRCQTYSERKGKKRPNPPDRRRRHDAHVRADGVCTEDAEDVSLLRGRRRSSAIPRASPATGITLESRAAG